MKHLLLILLLALTGVPVTQAQHKKQTAPPVYGKSFSPGKVVAARNLPQVLGQLDSASVQVTGQVLEVCQAKGCWMDIRLTDNSVMKVRFKDYAFFVPKDLKGKTVVLNGQAHKQLVSVADQKHYAQDAGKPAAEIQAITAPRQSITYTASGVIVR